jgi:UDP-N-acetylmuramate--alanine ligase
VWRGADFFDDYAHHPTAVEAVLTTLRSCFPGRRILAVFEPHQCSRLRGLMSAFAGALSLADELYVLPALRVREMAAPEEALELSRQLVRLIRNGHRQAKIAADLDHVAVTLDHVVRPGDIVVTLGAGRTDTIHDQINRRIQRDSAA